MKIFCSGIGGIGLSAYAAYQHACGHEVSGSDTEDSNLLMDLRKQGIAITIGQDGNALPSDADLFVYTLALPSNHPELVRAQQLGIEKQTYAQALGELVRLSGKKLIAVCGTHGKSSTTAMAAKVLLDAKLDPSVILGTKSIDLGGNNWHQGEGEWFLVEACEYRRSFLHLSPQIILVTNIDGDHFDSFRDMEDYCSAFDEFIERLPPDGVLIKPSALKTIQLGVPGKHMQENASLVLQLADLLNIQSAHKSLEAYQGCWRRMEAKGHTHSGALVIDDYGHHPREIRATLEALKEAHPGKRIVCIFQPHTHHRTIRLYDDFTHAFAAADLVVLPNIYDVRSEGDKKQVDIEQLIKDIASCSGVCTQQTVPESFSKDDVIVTMGAGDIWKVANSLIASSYSARHEPACISPCDH